MSKRKTSTLHQADPAEVRKGIEAFCKLLRDIKALPELLRPGYKRGEDDSMLHDYPGAERLIDKRLASEVFEGEGRYTGYIRALACYLVKSVNDACPGDDMTADEVMGTPEGAHRAEAETTEDNWPPEDIDEREHLALEAMWEIDALVKTLIGIDGTEGDDIVRRGLFIRIRQLASVAQSHLTGEGDAGRETAEMHEVVYGVRGEEEAEASHG